MKAINSYLGFDDVEIPSLKPGQVLVRVICFGITEDDIAVHEANGSISSSNKRLLGSEFSGIVKLVDPASIDDEPKFKEGDRVLGFSPSGGSMAEYISCYVDTVALIPNGISFTEAASIPDAWFSALQIVRQDVNVQKRDRVIVYNAMSSRGQAIVRLCQILGCRRVHCVVNSETAAQSAKSHLKLRGALMDELPVHKNDEKLLESIARYDHKGLESVIYLGGYPNHIFPEIVRPGGCIAVAPLCYQSPGNTNEPLFTQSRYELFTLKGQRFVGCNVRRRSPQSLATNTDFMTTHILPKFHNKQLKANVEKSFRWENISDAFDHVKSNPEANGKVVCVIDHTVF